MYILEYLSAIIFYFFIICVPIWYNKLYNAQYYREVHGTIMKVTKNDLFVFTYFYK